MENQNQKNSISQNTASANCEVPAMWLKRLAIRFTSLYGAKFTNTVSSEEQARDWNEAWGKALKGLSAKKIARGVDICATSADWPPSASEFRKMCEGFTDYELLYSLAANAVSSKKWPSKLVYWATSKFGFYEIVRTSYSTAKNRWKSIVDELLAQDTLPDIPDTAQRALPPTGQTHNRDIAKKATQELLAMLRQKAKST